MPFDITAFAMTEGTADGCRDDYREAGTEGCMNENFRSESCDNKGPEEEWDKDNPATNAEKTGQKTCQTTEKDKKDYSCKCKRNHDHPKAEQVSHIMADLLILEAPTRFELVMEILQTSALPLGDGAIKKESL